MTNSHSDQTLARYRPGRHRHLILIGLLGKILGPLGFVWSVAAGQLPAALPGRF